MREIFSFFNDEILYINIDSEYYLINKQKKKKIKIKPTKVIKPNIRQNGYLSFLTEKNHYLINEDSFELLYEKEINFSFYETVYNDIYFYIDLNEAIISNKKKTIKKKKIQYENINIFSITLLNNFTLSTLLKNKFKYYRLGLKPFSIRFDNLIRQFANPYEILKLEFKTNEFCLFYLVLIKCLSSNSLKEEPYFIEILKKFKNYNLIMKYLDQEDKFYLINKVFKKDTKRLRKKMIL